MTTARKQDGSNATQMGPTETTSPSPTPAPRRQNPSPRPGGCCKICHESQACGDTCISKQDTCHEAPGCACQGCCKICNASKACGDACISKQDTCHAAPGCACQGGQVMTTARKQDVSSVIQMGPTEALIEFV